MRPVALMACLLASSASFSQVAAPPVESRKATLAEQYYAMKTSASSYEDYKVIREYALDVMWKSVSDSLKATRLALQKAEYEITVRENDINTLRASLKLKEDSMADVVFASTHIRVLGVNFSKNFFLTLMTLCFAGFLVLIGAMTGRLKWMYYAMKEKIEGLNMLASEYEEYKRKALEKQMKLSRELQNERNKLSEFKVQKA